MESNTNKYNLKQATPIIKTEKCSSSISDGEIGSFEADLCGSGLPANKTLCKENLIFKSELFEEYFVEDEPNFILIHEKPGTDLDEKDFSISVPNENIVEECETDAFSDTFQKERSMSELRNSTSIVKKFKCSECQYKTNFKGDLKNHILSHFGIKKFKCSECEYRTNRKGRLDSHMLDHFGIKKFKCSECEYRTNCKTSLNIHVLNHSGIKKFQCPECEYGTNCKTSLNIHILNHSGIKKFKCSECEYRTNKKDTLKTHVLTHSDVKNFECSECEYKTKYKGSLKSHILTHQTGRGKRWCNLSLSQ